MDHHIFSGKVMAADMAVKKSIKTNEDLNVNIDINNRIEVDNITVLKSDLYADNDIIHAIDTVLMSW